MPTREQAEGERSWAEAGFLGLAVIHFVAAGVLIVLPALISLASGSFDAADYQFGLVVLFLGGVWWGLRHVARRGWLSN